MKDLKFELDEIIIIKTTLEEKVKDTEEKIKEYEEYINKHGTNGLHKLCLDTFKENKARYEQIISKIDKNLL